VSNLVNRLAAATGRPHLPQDMAEIVTPCQALFIVQCCLKNADDEYDESAPLGLSHACTYRELNRRFTLSDPATWYMTADVASCRSGLVNTTGQTALVVVKMKVE
jgi:hypothetical protein